MLGLCPVMSRMCNVVEVATSELLILILGQDRPKLHRFRFGLKESRQSCLHAKGERGEPAYSWQWNHKEPKEKMRIKGRESMPLGSASLFHPLILQSMPTVRSFFLTF